MWSQIRGGDSPGVDHLSALTVDLMAARSKLARNGISLIDPEQGLGFRDMDGPLISGGLQAQSMRLPVPSNLRSTQPAFATATLTEIHLRALDVDRSASFYSQLFGGKKLQERSPSLMALPCCNSGR